MGATRKIGRAFRIPASYARDEEALRRTRFRDRGVQRGEQEFK
jgi:hypothetical protein